MGIVRPAYWPWVYSTQNRSFKKLKLRKVLFGVQ